MGQFVAELLQRRLLVRFVLEPLWMRYMMLRLLLLPAIQSYSNVNFAETFAEIKRGTTQFLNIMLLAHVRGISITTRCQICDLCGQFFRCQQ